MHAPMLASEDLKTNIEPRPTLDRKSPTHGDSGARKESATRTPEPEASGEEPGTSADRISVDLTPGFLLLALLLAAAVAFCVGTACRIVLLRPPPRPRRAAAAANRGASAKVWVRPPAPEGGRASLGTFSTKLFQREATTTSRATRFIDRNDSLNEEKEDEDVTLKCGEEVVHQSSYHDEEGYDDDDDDEENEDKDKDKDEDETELGLRLPSGHHLLVDIKHVDAHFLSSEERLARAMFDLVEELGVAPLSYNCRSFAPSGVSCVGVASGRRLSVHTWPREGVAVVDLLAPGAWPTASLVPILPRVEELFAVPVRALAGETNEQSRAPEVTWSHKLRGFREGFGAYERYKNPLEADLGGSLLDSHGIEAKASLVSERTNFQHVDVVEAIDPWGNPVVLDRPDKVLFLDGVMQSSLFGESEYHEALVHPPMIAHPNPKRVAIIGGGEGATLREVLKHKTVQEVVMVEIDGELVELCKEYLPEWSNCTDIVGSDADSCFDDSRASVEIDDAFQWFIDRFGGEGENTRETFDVIVMDALDPDAFVEIVGSLYKDNQFIHSLFNGLSEEGVFAIQLGESDSIDDPALENGSEETLNMMEGLENAGFESIHTYDEGHSHFGQPWSYLVCFKDIKSRRNWYKTAAMVEIDLRRRIHGTKSGKPTLLSFDAPTMIGYQVPTKSDQVVYCRKEATPWDCNEHMEVDRDLVKAGMNAVGRPAYSPVFERRLRHTLESGAKEAMNSSVIDRISTAVQERTGEKWRRT